MLVTVRVKQAGKKRALIENQNLEINDPVDATLRAFINAIVGQQVEQYNSKTAGTNLLPFLSKDEMDTQTESGKINFGSIYNENKASILLAQESALQAFVDGLFSVFVDDNELKSLNDLVNLTETSVVTFIRLTFLAGSYW